MNVKLEAFWAGEWQSTWTLQNGQLSGKLMIRSHYFEMGNMQFNLDHSFENVALKDSSNAAEIIATIKKTEDKVSLVPAHRSDARTPLPSVPVCS